MTGTDSTNTIIRIEGRTTIAELQTQASEGQGPTSRDERTWIHARPYFRQTGSRKLMEMKIQPVTFRKTVTGKREGPYVILCQRS
jgi:hypothetical protein